ncbi:MAG: HDOD domain-containing protein, partial [Gammaproteobacteria bacterium]
MAQLNMLFMSSIESLISEDQLVLPTLPEIAIRAREVAEKPDTSLSDLIKVIHCDTAICARLIKVANSPFVIRASNPVNNIT